MQEVEKIVRSKMSRPHGANKRNVGGGNKYRKSCPACGLTFRGSQTSVTRQAVRHECAGIYQEV